MGGGADFALRSDFPPPVAAASLELACKNLVSPLAAVSSQCLAAVSDRSLAAVRLSGI